MTHPSPLSVVTDVSGVLMTPLELSIQQQLGTWVWDPWKDSSEKLAEWRSLVDSWQEELTRSGSLFRICWGIHPDLFVWMGPVVAYQPRSAFLQQRLSDTSVWVFVEEVVHLGNKPSDTVVHASKQGWEIFLRPTQYQAAMQRDLQKQDPRFVETLAYIGDPEQVILWRQEMNVAHEWGHRITDQKITYRDLLLDRLVHFPPEMAWQWMSWIQWLLEALAEWFPQEGVFFMIADIARQSESLARGLLLDRLRDLLQQGLSDFVPYIEGLILPYLREDSLPWDKLHARFVQVGEQLEKQLWQSIVSIPTSAEVTEATVQIWRDEQFRSWQSRMAT